MCSLCSTRCHMHMRVGPMVVSCVPAQALHIPGHTTVYSRRSPGEAPPGCHGTATGGSLVAEDRPGGPLERIAIYGLRAASSLPHTLHGKGSGGGSGGGRPGQCVSVHELGVDVGSHRCACRARCPLQLRPLPIAPPPVSQIPLSRIPYPGIPYPAGYSYLYPVSRDPGIPYPVFRYSVSRIPRDTRTCIP